MARHEGLHMEWTIRWSVVTMCSSVSMLVAFQLIWSLPSLAGSDIPVELLTAPLNAMQLRKQEKAFSKWVCCVRVQQDKNAEVYRRFGSELSLHLMAYYLKDTVTVRYVNGMFMGSSRLWPHRCKFKSHELWQKNCKFSNPWVVLVCSCVFRVLSSKLTGGTGFSHVITEPLYDPVIEWKQLKTLCYGLSHALSLWTACVKAGPHWRQSTRIP